MVCNLIDLFSQFNIFIYWVPFIWCEEKENDIAVLIYLIQEWRWEPQIENGEWMKTT